MFLQDPDFAIAEVNLASIPSGRNANWKTSSSAACSVLFTGIQNDLEGNRPRVGPAMASCRAFPPEPQGPLPSKDVLAQFPHITIILILLVLYGNQGLFVVSIMGVARVIKYPPY